MDPSSITFRGSTAKRRGAHRSAGLCRVSRHFHVHAHDGAARRPPQLVNQRLNEFYGPLYVATVAGNIAYRALLEKQGKTTAIPFATKR